MNEKLVVEMKGWGERMVRLKTLSKISFVLRVFVPLNRSHGTFVSDAVKYVQHGMNLNAYRPPLRITSSMPSTANECSNGTIPK